ncbi:MAG: GTPase [Candidatus Bathyarchaeota archaeon]
MKQPFENIGSIITAEELVDLAFRTASKVDIPRVRRNIVWVRKKERERIKIVEATITSRLNRTIKKMPRVEEIHPFYMDLVDVLVGLKNFKKGLAALNWAVKRIQSFSSNYSRRAGRARTISEASRIRREAYGRIASVLKQVSRDLTLLKEAEKKLAKLPSVDPNLITIIVAGYANVGKSTFVKQLSSAKPEIATYPFTSKGIVVGHRDTPNGRCQAIDTPGLLDRPLSERNKIELQAIAAIRYLADVIVFILDPSETCGYPLNSQLNLFKEIIGQFQDVPTINILNKVDLATEEQIELAKDALNGNVIEVSALKNQRVEEVFQKALDLASKRRKHRI